MEKRRCYGCMQLVEEGLCPHCGYGVSRDNEPHQLPVGTVLRGQYVVGKVLGQGGFGITYLGWDNHLETAICIKEYFPNHAVSRDCTVTTRVHCHTEQGTVLFAASKERFLREAKILAQFRDIPEIVSIYGFFEENNTVYIVMEYIKGMDLAHYVERRGGKLSADETFRILRPIMQALAQVHRSELVHRDIAPDNIMLHPRGGAKLLDFGAARVVEDAGVDKGLNRSTEAIVKHGFAPMEQYQTRGNLGPWTDVYAMCASIYYCLTGQVPPEATSRMMGEAELSWEQIPGLTLRQRAALEKGMAILARDRYSSMDALMEGLFGSDPAAGVGHTVPASASRPGATVQKAPSARKEKKKGRGGLIALVCVLTAALVLCVGLLLGSGILSPSPALEAGTAPIATEAPAAEAPATEAPATEAPAAEPPLAEISQACILISEDSPRTGLFVSALLEKAPFRSCALETVSGDLSTHEEAIFRSIAQGDELIIWQLPEDPDMSVVTMLCETAEASGIPLILTGPEPGGYASADCDAITNYSMVSYVGGSPYFAGKAQVLALLDSPVHPDSNGDSQLTYMLLIGSGDSGRDSTAIKQGIVETLEELGCYPDYCSQGFCNWDAQEAYEIACQLLNEHISVRGESPEVLFCSSDAIALAAQRAVTEMGMTTQVVGLGATEEGLASLAASPAWGYEAEARMIARIMEERAIGIPMEDYYYMDGTVAGEPEEDRIRATVSVQGLNIRSTPSTASKSTGTYTKGQVVTILQFQDVGGISWALTKDGWVIAQYLDIIE